jgi:hypothetical protein
LRKCCRDRSSYSRSVIVWRHKVRQVPKTTVEELRSAKPPWAALAAEIGNLISGLQQKNSFRQFESGSGPQLPPEAAGIASIVRALQNLKTAVSDRNAVECLKRAEAAIALFADDAGPL